MATKDEIQRRLMEIDAAKEQRVKAGMGIKPSGANTAPPLIRGISNVVNTAGDVAGAFREGLGSTRPVADIYRERTAGPPVENQRNAVSRQISVGGVTPPNNQWSRTTEQPLGIATERTASAMQNKQKTNWWDKSQLKEEAPMAQQSGKRPIHEVYKSPREALMAMPDSMFKAFADEHKHIPGLGYAENIDTGKMERLIPQSRQQTRGGVDISKLDESQLNAYANYMRAQTGEKESISGESKFGLDSRKADIDSRRADIESRRADVDVKKLEHEIANTDMKDPLKKAEMYQKIATAFGGEKYELDENLARIGKSTVANYDEADNLFEAMGIPSPKRNKATAKAPMTEQPSASENKGKKLKVTGKDGKAVYLISDGTRWK